MKKLSLKKTMLMVVLMAIVCIVSNVSYATGNIDDLLREMENQAGNITVIEEPKTNQAVVPTTTTENKVENTNTNTNTNTTLPKTGVDDTMLWVLIAVSVVAAGYTYKKVRDYNV